ncbi:hypothetical protein PDE_08557 [Penicillium oxalicum 114-2]|uniref:Uncharacterized protein n=1 Tax=Penicillium oxalicum (strain 114-2 / CGMCC 5302) TaxID=933388 RepID=S7ZS99_PENO1|nr:hypothetical protein PDE_08557 [Penicillium oxalicum 114-2]
MLSFYFELLTPFFRLRSGVVSARDFEKASWPGVTTSLSLSLLFFPPHLFILNDSLRSNLPFLFLGL